MRTILSLTLAVTMAAPAAAQVTPAPTPSTVQQTPRPEAEPDDIIVEGFRDRTDADRRTQVPPNVRAFANRARYDASERMAKCAARSKLSDLSRLRAVVDGEVNSGRHHVAQDRLVRIYITCGESPVLLGYTSRPQSAEEAGRAATVGFENTLALTDGAPLGFSIYDRGAFTIQALKFFAPDLTLTRAEVNDPVVQQRFNLRELPRNRMRSSIDYRYFEVAVCMTRLAPELAVRLAYSDGDAQFDDVQEALVERGRPCVGNARKVRIDPTQFRLYIADAVYRWAVAARGVGSLIPLTKEARVTPPAGSSPS